MGDTLAPAMVGYKALYYDPKTVITNDGNTVVEIYYDRIYYLVKYDIAEGYGVMPNYVRYGAQVMLGAPSNPGHTFESWQLTSVKDTATGNELLTDETESLITGQEGYVYKFRILELWGEWKRMFEKA